MFYVALVVVACSKDEDPVQGETAKNFSAKSNSGISEFSNPLDKFYGLDGYSVAEEPVIVKEEEGDYYAYKVTINADSKKEGYILETPKNGNFYYEHDIENKSVAEYNYDSTGKLNMGLTDMSGNPYYNMHGFNPTLAPDPVSAPARFWGWEITYSPCFKSSSGDGTYIAQVFATHYIGWIGGEEKRVLMYSPTGSGILVNAYVDCIDGVPGGYTGDIITY